MPTVDELTENWEQKIEELIALESIYGSDFRLFGNQGSSACASNLDVSSFAKIKMPSESTVIESQVRISVDVPEAGILITLDPRLDLSPHNMDATDTRVYHLPQIILDISMPPGYPLCDPPRFSLTGVWLSTKIVHLATSSLQGLLEDAGPGVPICFAWIDWLKTTMLESLGGLDPLVILAEYSLDTCHQDMDDDVWKEIAIRSESVMHEILRYNAMCKQHLFDERTWNCCICFEEKLGRDFMYLSLCDHKFCRDCFSAFCRVSVWNGDFNLKCPAHKCKTTLEPHMVKEALSKSDFERWEEILLHRSLGRMKDVHYCPRCSAVCIEESGFLSQCGSCFFAFCTKCRDKWHPESDSCYEEDSSSTLHANVSNKADPLGAYRLELAEDAPLSTRCPGCGILVNRTGGCSTMTCTLCTTMFCYRCGKVIIDYHHPLAECVEIDKNHRFPESQSALAVKRKKKEMDIILRVAREEGVSVAQSNCPYCGQRNTKYNNNNHIRCWACLKGYCHMCGTGLGKRMGSHFLQGTCKQHTED